MFRITHVSMYQWHQYRKLRLPFTRLVCLISGRNGSGKTTILDGIRVCLGCGVSRKRTLRGYLSQQGGPALLRLIVTNPKDVARGRHVWQSANPALNSEEVTIACWVRNVGAAAPDRRFLIMPGRVEEKLLEILFQDKQGIDLADFHRAIKAIGMDARIIERLIIEQGRIGEVAGMDARDRYKLVEAQLMEPETIRRFGEALKKLRDAEGETIRQKERLASSEADLLIVETQKHRRAKYDDLKLRRDEAQVDVWIAKLQGTLQTQAAAEAILSTEGERLPSEKIAHATAEKLLQELVERAKAFQVNETRWKAELRDLSTWKDERMQLIGKIRLQLEEIETDAIKLISLPGTTVEEARAEWRAAERGGDEARLEVLSHKRATTSLQDDVDRLARNEPLYPPAVREVWTLLEAEKVPVVILKDVISPHQLPTTFEDALGDMRYAIITNKASFPRVCELAKTHAYPGPIYAGTRKGEGPASIELTDDAPPWLEDYLAGIQFGEDSWTDSRGTWFNKESPILHGPTLKIQLEQKRNDLRAAYAAQYAAERNAEAAADRLQQSAERFTTAKERERLAERVNQRAQLEAEKSALQRDVREKEGQLEKLQRRVYSGEVERNSLTANKQEFESRRDTCKARIRSIELEINAAETSLKDAIEIQEVAKANLTLGQQARVTAKLPSVQACEARFESLTAELNEIDATDLPNEEVYDKHDRLKGAVQEAREGLARVERARTDYEQETTASRLAYMSRANGALMRYRDRVKELCKFVNMEPDMAIPTFTENATNNEIENAEIHLRFRFGDDAWRKSGDGTFSGGQTVLQGLIQLMALAELNKDAFFIVDEPYAHLSIDRIDQVAAFLETSGPQFIVTAPTGLNKDLFGTATQVIVASPKPDGEKFLPHPALGSEDILHA